jgi:hypothetical protein
MLHVRIITHRDAEPLLANLRRAHFGVTLVQGHGSTGPVNIILTVIKRKQMPAVARIIRDYDPRAFYAVDELQTASAGIFPLTQTQRAPQSYTLPDTAGLEEAVLASHPPEPQHAA